MFRFLNGVAQEKPPIKPSIASVIPFATHYVKLFKLYRTAMKI